MIPKKCTDKLRPLDIMGEKVVQKAMAIALDILFEENICPSSHGFQRGKGVHSALKDIKDYFGGITFNIEGDIKNCFGEIDHGILLFLLEKKISCPKFLKLVYKLITIGFIDPTTGHHCRVAKGVPQGCIPRPVLANIYLSCLDIHITKLRLKYNGRLPGPSRAFWAVFNKAKAAGTTEEKNKIAYAGFKDIFSKYEYDDPRNFHLKYVRYADDFVVGVFGPESFALGVKDNIRKYLSNYLKLQLRDEKTVITPGNKGFTFLGIKVQTRPTFLVDCKFGFRSKPDPIPLLYADKDTIIAKLEEKGFVRQLKMKGSRWVGKRVEKWHNLPIHIIKNKYMEV